MSYLRSQNIVKTGCTIAVSVTILTRNSEKYLDEVLSALTDFSEVLIYDTGSQDSTLAIAERFRNTTIHRALFEGFGPTHNKASALARNDWILSIDSDEVVTPELAQEIASIDLCEGSVYSFPRQNFYNGKWIKWCGWHPDRQVRIYNRNKTRFTDAQVHEAIICEGMQHVELQRAIRHYSYENTSDFLAKMQSYSELFAIQNKGKKSSSLSKAIGHGLYAFVKSFILKRGFMGGFEGFAISTYNANTAFYKYLKLAEKNRKPSSEPVKK